MFGNRFNPNHRNSFQKKEETVLKNVDVEDVIVEKKELDVFLEDTNLEESEEEVPYTEKEFYLLNKSEQIEILEDLGLDKKEIRDLKYEEDRVTAILTLQLEEE